MALDSTGESHEQNTNHQMQAEIEMKLVPALPDGRAVFPAEREGKFVWLIAEGAMTEQCFSEMRDYLSHIADHGMWVQNWGGEPQLV